MNAMKGHDAAAVGHMHLSPLSNHILGTINWCMNQSNESMLEGK